MIWLYIILTILQITVLIYSLYNIKALLEVKTVFDELIVNFMKAGTEVYNNQQKITKSILSSVEHIAKTVKELNTSKTIINKISEENSNINESIKKLNEITATIKKNVPELNEMKASIDGQKKQLIVIINGLKSLINKK